MFSLEHVQNKYASLPSKTWTAYQQSTSSHNVLFTVCSYPDWLVVFNVPSTARSLRDGAPICCPLWRTWSVVLHHPHRESNPGSLGGSNSWGVYGYISYSARWCLLEIEKVKSQGALQWTPWALTGCSHLSCGLRLINCTSSGPKIAGSFGTWPVNSGALLMPGRVPCHSHHLIHRLFFKKHCTSVEVVFLCWLLLGVFIKFWMTFFYPWVIDYELSDTLIFFIVHKYKCLSNNH